MASPSPSARKKKRARRNSGGGHKSTSPAGAAAASPGGGSEGGRSPSSSSAAVKPARTVSLEGSSSEKAGGAGGKRRRPTASQGFPHSFPRLNGGVSLAPPSRRRATLDSRINPAGGSGEDEEAVGVERTSLGDLRDAASGHQRREGGGGGGGLVAAWAPTMSVPASVPARRLQELFLGGDGGRTSASMSSTAPAAPALAAAGVAVTARSAGEAAVATPTPEPVGLAAAAAASAAASKEDSIEGPRRRRRRRHSSSGDGVGESGASSAAIRVPLPTRRGAPPRSSSSSSSNSGGCGLFEELIPLGVLAVAAGGTAGAEARASSPSPRETSSSAVPGTAALPPSAAGDVFVGMGVGEGSRSASGHPAGDESPPAGGERSCGGEIAGRAAGKRSAARVDARREGGSAVGEADKVRGRGDALDGAAEAPGGTARRGRGKAADGKGSVCGRSDGAGSGVLQETPSPQLLCVLETPPGSLPEALEPAPSPPPRPFAEPGASTSSPPPPLSSPSPPRRSTPAAEADVCAPIPETPQAPSRRNPPVAAAATTTRRRTRSARKTPPTATATANANAGAGPPEPIPETQGYPPRAAPKAGSGGQGRAARSPRGCSADRAVAEAEAAAAAAATRGGDGRARRAADETSAGAVSVPETQPSPQAPLRPSLAGTPSPPTSRNSPGRGGDPVASTGRSGAEPEGTPQSGGRPAVPESQQPSPEEQGTVAPRRGRGRTTLIRRAPVGQDDEHPGAVGGAMQESPPPPPLPPSGGGGAEAAHWSGRGSRSRSSCVAGAATGIAPEAAVAVAFVAPTRKGAEEEEGSCLQGPAAAAAVRDEATLHAKTESSPSPRPPPPTTDAETSVAVAAEASSKRESVHGKEQEQQQRRVRVRKPPPSDDPPSKGSKDPGGGTTTPPRDDREADGSGAHAVNVVPPPAPPRRAPSPTTPRRDGLTEEARRLEGRSRVASQPGSSSSSSGTGAAATEMSTACPVGGATQPSAGVVGLGNDSGERPDAGGGDDGIEVEQTVAGDTRAAALGAGSAAACAQGALVDQATAYARGVRAAGEGAVTPARPRRPPAQRLDGNSASTAENGGASADGGDGYAVADEQCPSEGGSQTPSSSGAGFDYFPTGYSQATDIEQADRRGVTAADMLSFQRSLCEELPVNATTTIAAPTKPAPSPPQQPPSAKKETLPSPPPSSRPPPVTGWVPNPYETGVGSMLTPGRKRREPKALPASPFAIAADAAARRVEAAAKREVAAAAEAAAATKAATTSSARTTAAAARGVAGAASPNASRPFGSSRQHASSAGGGAAAPSPSPASVHKKPTKPGGGCGSRDPRAAQSAGPSAAGKPPNPSSQRQDQQKPNSLGQPGALKSPGPEPPRCTPTTGDAASGNVAGGLGAPSDLVPMVVQAGGSGFQTARGRPLSVSAEALAKVSHIFNEPLAGGEGAADGDGGDGLRSAVSSGRGARDMSRGGLGGVAAGGTPVVDGGVAAVGSAAGGELGMYDSSSTSGAETAAAPSEPTRDVGFRTARGRPVAVSAEALVRVEHLFREEGSSLAGGRHAAVVSFSGGTRPAAAKGPGCRGGTTNLSPSDRGIGTTVVSCNVADDSSGGSGGGPSTKEEGQAGWPAAAAAAGSSSFQTAQGRPLAVSAEALAKVEHIFAEQQADGGGNKDGASAVVAAAAGSGSASVHPESSSSATPATGRNGARLEGNTAPAGGNSAAAGVVSSSSGGLTGGNYGGGDGGSDGGGGGGCSGFQTGRGRALAVSAEALAKVQHLFQGNDDGGGGGSGGAMESEARELRASRPPATGGSGFQTGRGRALTVSAEAALAKVQHLFQGNDDGGGGGGAIESPATGLRASRPPAARARRHQQATPRSGGKPFRRPSAVRKPRVRGDTGGIPGPVTPAPGLRGQAATSEASPTKASAGVVAGEGVITVVPPAASAGKGRSTASSGSGGGGGTTTVRAGVGGGGLGGGGGGGGVVGVSEEDKETKAPSPATNGSGAGDGGGLEKPRGSVETLAEAVDDDDAGEVGENEAGSCTDSTTTTTTPHTSGRQPQTTTKRSTDVDSLRAEGPAPAPRGAAEAPAPPTPAASGFITGGGRPVHVSAEALLKAKRLLADASGDDIEAAAGVERGAQEGAATARQGAPLPLSQSTTRRAVAQRLAIPASDIDMSDARQGGDDWNGSGGRDAKPPAVGEGDGDGGSRSGSGSAGGFSTGSGRRVEVSPEALERARQMFAECEEATPSGAGGRGGDGNPSPAIGGSGGKGGIGRSGLGGVVGGARGPGGGGTGGGVFSIGRGKLAAAPLSLRPDGPRVPCFRLPPPLPPPWLAALAAAGSRHHHPRGEGSSLVVLPRLPFAVVVVVAAVALPWLLPADFLLLPWSLAVEQAAAESVSLQPRSRS
ncbi:unnamed protein product [Ectocarpus sp. 12 AP-2014]